MEKPNVRVAYVSGMTMVCLEDLLDFYHNEYYELAKVATNGDAQALQSSDTAKILKWLTILQEEFGRDEG